MNVVFVVSPKILWFTAAICFAGVNKSTFGHCRTLEGECKNKTQWWAETAANQTNTRLAMS